VSHLENTSDTVFWRLSGWKTKRETAVSLVTHLRGKLPQNFWRGRFALHPPSSLSILYSFSLLSDTRDTSVSNKGNTGGSRCVACCRLCRFDVRFAK